MVLTYLGKGGQVLKMLTNLRYIYDIEKERKTRHVKRFPKSNEVKDFVFRKYEPWVNVLTFSIFSNMNNAMLNVLHKYPKKIEGYIWK